MSADPNCRNLLVCYVYIFYKKIFIPLISFVIVTDPPEGIFHSILNVSLKSSSNIVIPAVMFIKISVRKEPADFP